MKYVRIWGEMAVHYVIAGVMGAIHGAHGGPMYLALVALLYALSLKEKLRATK